MPIARFQMPDGRIGRFEVPEGTTPEQAQQMIAGSLQSPKEPSFSDNLKQELGNLGAGAVRGAGSIGATILTPIDAAARAMGIQNDYIGRNDRREAMNGALQEMGAQPESLAFQAGKMGGEIAGTAGVPGVLAKGAQALRFAPAAVEALRTAGMAGGSLPARMAAGAATGGAMAGLANPEDATTGAVIGGALPAAVPIIQKTADLAKSGAQRLMQSALKPTLPQIKSGEATTAVNTLLEQGINPTRGGVEKMKGMIDDLNDQIAQKISASNARISKSEVLSAIKATQSKFMSQVSPGADLDAINKVAEDFASHPYFAKGIQDVDELKNVLETAIRQKQQALQAAGKLQTFAAQQKSLAEGQRIPLSVNQPEFQPYYNTGSMGRVANSPSSQPVEWMPRIPARYTHNIERVAEGEAGYKDAMNIYAQRKAEEEAAKNALSLAQQQANTLPIQQAQQLKQGTYGILAKKYGQIGSAETEAQKALARGLKEGIVKAVPEVGPLNAQESKLIQTLNVAERRALMDMNKNPMGLSLLANNPASWAAFMADKSALFKSLAARMVNQTGKGLESVANVPMNAKLAAALMAPHLGGQQ